MPQSRGKSGVRKWRNGKIRNIIIQLHQAEYKHRGNYTIIQYKYSAILYGYLDGRLFCTV